MFKELFTEANLKQHADTFHKAWKKKPENKRNELSKDWEEYKNDLYDTGIITQKDLKSWGFPFNEDLTESKYEVYHSTYTSAIQAAEKFAKKQGYDLDPEEMATEIGMGPGKPKGGKTVKHSLGLFKNGAPIRGKKRLQIQVYDRGQTGNRYELNCYIS